MRSLARSTRAVSRTLGTPLLAACLLAIVGAPAQAQLGGLMKKAKDKVAKEVGDKSGANAALDGEQVTFDATTVELTPERLDGMVEALRASRAKLSGRPALIARRDAAAARLDEHMEKHGQEIDRAVEQRAKVRSCHDDAFRKIEEASAEGMSARFMASPALQQKMQNISQRMAAAQQKGDANEIQKLQGELKALNAPTAADSAKVHKACGAIPPESGAEREATSLQNEVKRLDTEIRSLEQGAAAEASKASGLSPLAYAVATDRIQMYLSRAKSNSPQRGLTSSEIKALNARRSDLEKVV